MCDCCVMCCVYVVLWFDPRPWGCCSGELYDMKPPARLKIFDTKPPGFFHWRCLVGTLECL